MLFLFACGALFWIIVLGPVSCGAPETQTTDKKELPALGATLAGTTVSGLSSGAYMAEQFQLAHADIVAGAAIVAGGPYACAESAFTGLMPDAGVQILSATRASSGCMLDTLAIYGVPDAQKLAERARELSEAGRIGQIADIVSDRVYVFSGTNDQVVRPRIVTKTVEFYSELGVPEANINAVMNVPAGHAMITLDQGGSCEMNAVPYIVDCDYDQVGAFFSFLYSPASEPSGPSTGSFVEFDQQEFTEGLASTSLTSTAVVYVPQACEKGRCRVHVAFHGCQQNRDAVKTAFTRDAGYGRWADANKVVVLFPEVGKSALNPLGCWDWWGYTGPDYLTRDAPQITAVRRMLDRLAGSGGQS
ncbi:MAG: PHB depolymerase family esterase [Alphaproteobacteria bacterium]|nr:PHB depolymerase family esterase [Alphaproteobacteria bacterium]